MAVLEETPPNTVLDFRSDSPAITTKEQIISDRDANVSVQTVKCSKCDRPFTLERIQKHEQICNKVKERKAFDKCIKHIEKNLRDKRQARNDKINLNSFL